MLIRILKGLTLMPHTIVLGYTLYELLWFFFIYSVIGWAIETVYESVHQRKLVNRGFLNGFYCPIYGFGMLGILFALSGFFGRPLLLFLGGMAFATTLEYFTGWLMETVFGSRWWDYSENRFNIKGRICLFTSVVWGTLCMVFIEFIHPGISRVINQLDYETGRIVLMMIYTIGIIDFTVSLNAAIRLSSRIKALAGLKDRMLAFVLQSAPLEEAEFIKRKFRTSKIGEILADTAERLKNMAAETVVHNRSGLQQRLEAVREKYEQIIGRIGLNERRFFRAFPKLRFPKLPILSDELRDRIKSEEDKK